MVRYAEKKWTPKIEHFPYVHEGSSMGYGGRGNPEAYQDSKNAS